jgi:2,4-dienoyl-CoA reductase-like NADH-dependent reductase (Old Yellow Enzyme family)
MLLFEPLQIRGVTLPNRIVVSPMCQYSYTNGMANDWLFVHLGSRAVGGAGVVIAEASAVLPEGRISPYDLGIWSDAHADALAPAARFIKSQRSVPAIQIAHAGRKASTRRPWEGGEAAPVDEGGWREVHAPSAKPFSDTYPKPTALTKAGIQRIVAAFGEAAARAAQAGFELIEIHSAHGYLLHEFLSPLTNERTDEYGGDLHSRARALYEVVAAVRQRIPEKIALFVRVSATDWVPGGLKVEDVVEVAKRLKGMGVDVIDCSSGGTVPGAHIPFGPGYQTPFAQRIRAEADIKTAAVGMIIEPAQAEHILRSGQADVVLLAREMLRDPYWPMHAAQALGVHANWPIQYLRAAPAGSKARPEITNQTSSAEEARLVGAR